MSIEHTVCSWPDKQWICALLRMSHTRHTLSRPPVISTSRVGCRAILYTPRGGGRGGRRVKYRVAARHQHVQGGVQGDTIHAWRGLQVLGQGVKP